MTQNKMFLLLFVAVPVFALNFFYAIYPQAGRGVDGYVARMS